MRSFISFRMLSNETDSVMHLLSHLYAQRSFSLWKTKTRAAWFSVILNSLGSKLPNTPLQPPATPKSPSPRLLRELFGDPSLRFSIYRHVLVLESTTRAGRLFGFIPQAVVAGKQLACDPLPPPSRVSEYNVEFFQGAEDPMSVRPRGRREAQRLLEQLVPDPVFRRQLQVYHLTAPFVIFVDRSGVITGLFRSTSSFCTAFSGRDRRVCSDSRTAS